MFKFFLTAIVIAFFQQTLLAAPYTPDSFAYSATLSTAKTSIRQLELPLDIIQKMARNDYGDLRVFNSEGQIVPHKIKKTNQQESDQRLALTFYPFSKEQSINPNTIRIVINQQQGRQSLEINQKLGVNSKQKIKEYQYIISNKITETPICKMDLDWTQTRPNLILPFKLESSSDLQNWKTIKRKLTVSRLNYGGSELLNKQVSFTCSNQKYLRLTWLNLKQNVHLNKITGIYTKNNEVFEQSSSLGKPQYDGSENWLFENNTIASVTKMEFVAPQDGLLYKGILYSRDDPKKNWKYRREITQYRLNLGESQLQSKAILLRPNHDRYWKLALDSEGKFSESQLPDIRIGWKSNQLYFLAQGKGPFQLAFGNPSIGINTNRKLDSLIESIKDSGSIIDNVSLGQITSNQSYSKAEVKLPWKLILLWMVLILGTILMGFMAYRLYQQMSEGNK